MRHTRVDTDLNPAKGEFAESLKKVLAFPRYRTPASPAADFVTGASLTIDGGFTA